MGDLRSAAGADGDGRVRHRRLRHRRPDRPRSGATDLEDDGGAAILEFALLLPVLFLLIGGVVDFGFAFNAQVSLTHAAREGVRLEALATGDAAGAAEAAFFAPAVVDGTASAAVTRPCPDPNGAQVTITADYAFFFINIVPTIDDEITLTGQAVMRCGG